MSNLRQNKPTPSSHAPAWEFILDAPASPQIRNAGAFKYAFPHWSVGTRKKRAVTQRATEESQRTAEFSLVFPLWLSAIPLRTLRYQISSHPSSHVPARKFILDAPESQQIRNAGALYTAFPRWSMGTRVSAFTIKGSIQ